MVTIAVTNAAVSGCRTQTSRTARPAHCRAQRKPRAPRDARGGNMLRSPRVKSESGVEQAANAVLRRSLRVLGSAASTEYCGVVIGAELPSAIFLDVDRRHPDEIVASGWVAFRRH